MAKTDRPVAIVTGARRGIGAAIAASLARSGFDVAITDVADDGAEDTLAEIAAAGGRARFILSDIAIVADHFSIFAA